MSAELTENEALRELVHILWAAWNDDTIALHAALVDHMSAEDLPGLDLTDEQEKLLARVHRWKYGVEEWET